MKSPSAARRLSRLARHYSGIAARAGCCCRRSISTLHSGWRKVGEQPTGTGWRQQWRRIPALCTWCGARSRTVARSILLVTNPEQAGRWPRRCRRGRAALAAGPAAASALNATIAPTATRLAARKTIPTTNHGDIGPAAHAPAVPPLSLCLHSALPGHPAPSLRTVNYTADDWYTPINDRVDRAYWGWAGPPRPAVYLAVSSAACPQACHPGAVSALPSRRHRDRARRSWPRATGAPDLPSRGGALGVPGGWLGRGETPREAAARETFEETGGRSIPSRVLSVGSGPYGEISLAYECRIVGAANFRPSDETDQIGYFALSDLPEMSTDTRRMLEQAIAAQARWPESRSPDSPSRARPRRRATGRRRRTDMVRWPMRSGTVRAARRICTQGRRASLLTSCSVPAPPTTVRSVRSALP